MRAHTHDTHTHTHTHTHTQRERGVRHVIWCKRILCDFAMMLVAHTHTHAQCSYVCGCYVREAHTLNARCAPARSHSLPSPCISCVCALVFARACVCVCSYSMPALCIPCVFVRALACSSSCSMVRTRACSCSFFSGSRPARRIRLRAQARALKSHLER